MQTIWGRASQARTSCRCPSCSFQHRSVPRRRTTSSIAQHFYSSTTAFAVSFSTAVAGASYLDVKSKQKRRAALETGIAQARAEAQALREDQDVRLRALGIDPAVAKKVTAPGLDTAGKQGKTATRAAPRANTQPNHSDIRSPPGQAASVSRVKLMRGNGYNESEVQNTSLTKFRYVRGRNEALPPIDDISLASFQYIRTQEQPSTDNISLASFQYTSSQEEPWTTRSCKVHGHRVALMGEVLVSRLIYQLELLSAHLEDGSTSQSTERPSWVASAENRLRDLDILFKDLRESIWQSSWNAATVDARIGDIQSNLESTDVLRVHYDWAKSPGWQFDVNAVYEDRLLDLFAKNRSAAELLQRLSELLLESTALPSIHAFNIIIVGLCNHGLPCAARLVLEFLRRSPLLEGNAVTHEAAIRCSLLDRDGTLFSAYYGNMKCQNKLGWHFGLPSSTGKKVPLFKHAKRLHHNFKPKVEVLHQAPMTYTGAEAVIRALLRSRNIGSALQEYNSFRKAGGEPTLHLLEAFLRYCFFANDLQLGLSTWKQICCVSDKPPSSAYYWMLGILSRSSSQGPAFAFTADEKPLRIRLFDKLSNELYGDAGNILRWHRFTYLGVSRDDLWRMAEKIEDMSVPQWLPGTDQDSLPEMLNTDGPFSQAGRSDLPRTLGSYIRHQYQLLDKHAPCGVVVHRTSKHEQFFAMLSKTTCASDLTSRALQVFDEADTEAAAKPVEAEGSWTDSTPDENWEDIEEHVEPRSVVPPLARIPPSPAPVPTFLPWRFPMGSLPMRLPRHYTLPSPRLGRNERLATA